MITHYIISHTQGKFTQQMDLHCLPCFREKSSHSDSYVLRSMQNVFPFSVPKSEDHPTNNFTVDIKLDLKRESFQHHN